MNFILIILFYFCSIKFSIQKGMMIHDEIGALDDFYNNNEYHDQSGCKCPNIKNLPFKNNTRDIGIDELNWFGSIHTRRVIQSKTIFVPLCSATVITNKAALTSARCMKGIIITPLEFPHEDYESEQQKDVYMCSLLFLSVGKTKDLRDIYVDKNYTRSINQIIYHPEYNETTGEHDIVHGKIISNIYQESFTPLDIDLGCIAHSSNNDYTKFSQFHFYWASYQVDEYLKKDLATIPFEFRYLNYTKPIDTAYHDIDLNNTNIITERREFRVDNTKAKLFTQNLINLCPGTTKDYWFYCTKSPDGAQYTSCPTDAGSPLFYYDKFESRLVILGINTMITNRFDMDNFVMLEEYNSTYVECGARSINKFTPIHRYLRWIRHEIGLPVCIQPEMMAKRDKYCKCKNKDFTYEKFKGEERSLKSKSNIKGRIINGTDVSENDFAYSAIIFTTLLHLDGIKEWKKSTKFNPFGERTDWFYHHENYTRHFRFLCTGTILNRDFVLTSRDCSDAANKSITRHSVGDNSMEDYSMEPHDRTWYTEMTERDLRDQYFLYASAGSDRKERTIANHYNRRKVVVIHNHPNYVVWNDTIKSPYFKGDYALSLLEVVFPFEFGSRSGIFPAYFNPRESVYNLVHLFAIGYGPTAQYKDIVIIDEDKDKRFRKLFKRYHVETNETDYKFYGENRELLKIQMKYLKHDLNSKICSGNERIICAQPLIGNLCDGNDGAGLFRYDIRRDKFYFIGVFSNAINYFDHKDLKEAKFCYPGSTNAFISVYHNMKWIKSVIGHDGCWSDNDPYFSGDF